MALYRIRLLNHALESRVLSGRILFLLTVDAYHPEKITCAFVSDILDIASQQEGHSKARLGNNGQNKRKMVVPLLANRRARQILKNRKVKDILAVLPQVVGQDKSCARARRLP